MMNNIKKVPDVRVKGFYGEWEQEFLKDNVEFYSGLTYKPSDVCKKSSSSVLVIRSSNIKNGKFVFNNDDVYVKEEALNSTITDMNDIAVVVRNGSRPLIGKHGIVTKHLKKATVGAFMTGIRAYRFNFINILLDTNTFRKQVDENMGATINQITNSTLNSMCFYFPNSNEQAQIGNFFKNLDEKLELEKEKLEKLINFKKAMLYDMFPKEGEKVPKVRFDCFDDEWEIFKIKKICEFFNGAGHENIVLEYGKYEIINSKFISTEGKIKKYAMNQLVELKKDDIVFVMSDLPNGKALGKTYLITQDNKYTLNQRIGCYRVYDNKRILPNFINMIVNRNPQYLFYDDGVNQTNLKKDEVLNITLNIPSYSEQLKIGNFFKNLDEKIELSEKKIVKIENFKKAMLDKMFV